MFKFILLISSSYTLQNILISVRVFPLPRLEGITINSARSSTKAATRLRFLPPFIPRLRSERFISKILPPGSATLAHRFNYFKWESHFRQKHLINVIQLRALMPIGN